MSQEIRCPDCNGVCRKGLGSKGDWYICLNPACLMMGFDKKNDTVVHWSKLEYKTT